MCLIVKKGCAPEIAQKDITCWKLVDVDYIQQIWTPCIYTYTHAVFPLNKVVAALKEYEKIEHLTIEIAPHGLRSVRYINYGFHAKTHVLPNYNICVIPKGAEYCLGEDDDIVSTKMIVFGTLFDYLWYKLKKCFK